MVVSELVLISFIVNVILEDQPLKIFLIHVFNILINVMSSGNKINVMCC